MIRVRVLRCASGKTVSTQAVPAFAFVASTAGRSKNTSQPSVQNQAQLAAFNHSANKQSKLQQTKTLSCVGVLRG